MSIKISEDQEKALKQLGKYEKIEKIHVDESGDLIVKCKDKSYVVTIEGRVLQQCPNCRILTGHLLKVGGIYICGDCDIVLMERGWLFPEVTSRGNHIITFYESKLVEYLISPKNYLDFVIGARALTMEGKYQRLHEIALKEVPIDAVSSQESEEEV